MQHVFVVSVWPALLLLVGCSNANLGSENNYNYKFVLSCVVTMLLQQLDLCCHSTASEILSHIIAGSCPQLVNSSPQSMCTYTSTMCDFPVTRSCCTVMYVKTNFQLLCGKLNHWDLLLVSALNTKTFICRSLFLTWKFYEDRNYSKKAQSCQVT